MTSKIKASCVSSPPCTGRPRRIGCLIFISDFPQKSPTFSGSFPERDLQLRHCMNLRQPVEYRALSIWRLTNAHTDTQTHTHTCIIMKTYASTNWGRYSEHINIETYACEEFVTHQRWGIIKLIHMWTHTHFLSYIHTHTHKYTQDQKLTPQRSRAGVRDTSTLKQYHNTNTHTHSNTLQKKHTHALHIYIYICVYIRVTFSSAIWGGIRDQLIFRHTTTQIHTNTQTHTNTHGTHTVFGTCQFGILKHTHTF